MIAPEADSGRDKDPESPAAANERPYPIASDGGNQLAFDFGASRRRAHWAEACRAMSELMGYSRVAVLCQIRGVEEFFL